MSVLRTFAAAAAVMFATSASAVTYDFNSQTIPGIFSSVQGYSFRTESGNPGNTALAFVGATTSSGTAPSGNEAGGQLRQFTTVGLDLSAGGTITLDLLIGTDSTNAFGYFENVDAVAGENFRLSYSLDGGASFTQILLIDGEATGYQNTFGSVSAAIPLLAQTASTVLHFSQLSNSGAPYDHWAVDNLTIDTSRVPVPAALPLLVTGFAAMRLIGRRRKAA